MYLLVIVCVCLFACVCVCLFVYSCMFVCACPRGLVNIFDRTFFMNERMNG